MKGKAIALRGYFPENRNFWKTQARRKEIEEHPEPPNKKGVLYSLLTDYIKICFNPVRVEKSNGCKLKKNFFQNKKLPPVNAILTCVNCL
jgi:hypothetical protein